MIRIYSGQTVRIDGTFEQPGDDGVASLFDPAPAPTLTVRHPASGTQIVATVQRDDTGRYHADVVVAHPGLWTYRWATSGVQPSVNEGAFRVEY